MPALHHSLVTLALLPAAVPAQTAAARLLVGQHIVDAEAGRTLVDLAISPHARFATPVTGQSFVVEQCTVDIADPAVLEVRGDALLLRRGARRDAEPLWQRNLADLGALQSNAFARLLTRDRVVLPRAGGGVVALDRSTGERRWQRADCAVERLLADADLLLAAGVVDGKPRLGAFALANGATAFHADLPGTPRLLAAAPHGVVVAGEGFVVGFDRSGPELFVHSTTKFPHRETLDRVVSSPTGWYTISGTRVRSLDRRGATNWTADIDPEDWRDSRQLFVTGDGDLLVLAHQRMSDSGVLVRRLSRRDGAQLWKVDLSGLEVGHSKYWHETYACVAGEHVYVVSQGAAGAFWVQLDLETGGQLARHRL